MIFCEYTDLESYAGLIPGLDKAKEAVKQLEEAGFPGGRHDFDGGFINIQRGTTKPAEQGLYEAHRKYIDVQYVIQGSEEMLYMPLSDLQTETPYDENADIAFYKSESGRGTAVKVSAGMCYVVFPNDGHMPCRHTDKPTEYLKLIIKLPVNK